MRLSRLLLLLLCPPLLTTQALAQTDILNSQQHRILVETLVSDLRHPTAMAFLPTSTKDQWQLLISERGGKLKLLTASGAVTDIRNVPQSWQRGDGGLLGLAVQPTRDADARVFIAFAGEQPDGSAATKVVSALLSNNELTSITQIFTAQPAYRGSKRFGGRMLLDGDCLWLSVGDRGDSASAQDMTSHAGSILRLTVAGQPCSGTPQLPAEAQPGIVSKGHREIRGMALDNQGRIWTHEAGPDRGDELNLLIAGKNYGWPVVTEGTRTITRLRDESEPLDNDYQPAVYEWVSPVQPSGLLSYSGDLFTHWRNNLFLGSLKYGTLIRLELREGEVFRQERLLKNRYGPIVDVAQGSDGAIYLLTDSSDGKLLRLTPAG
ncbi:PQQ-dependent sugar dehydrogenase [Shewanella sp. GXUN23E]|uniref:PQQ-dependent sugar dehydrogenase n=1 Tax=Shewanella sp. GXUN23E TaxID=3422498 RepID=UPI003D7D37B8